MKDTTVSALTPEGIAYTLHPAGLLSRASANAVDTALQWALLAVFYISTQFLRGDGGMWVLFLALFAVNWFFHFVCEVFLAGQSPGKKILALRVVMEDGSPVTPAASLIRNLLRFADTFLCLYQIALLSICLTRGFRRIGDAAAGTLVVYTSKARPVFSRVKAASQGDFAQLAPARALSFDEKRAVISFSGRYALLGKARGDEITSRWAATLAKTESPSALVISVAKNWTGA
jgi:uncharacterized RDD family membrane protein YckC